MAIIESEICTPFSYSEKMGEQLKDLGISFTQITVGDVLRIYSRDNQGDTLPYNVGFSDIKRQRTNWGIVKDDIEIGYYCSGILSRYFHDREGEVGIIQLAPAMRGKGISSLIRLYAYTRLVEQRATSLRSVDGDGKGRISKLYKPLGFERTQREICDQAEWRLPIDNREHLLTRFNEAFKPRLKRVEKAALSFDPRDIDRDNPRLVSILETSLSRLATLPHGMLDQRTIFGYPLAPIYISQQRLPKGERVVLAVKGRQAEDIASALEESVSRTNAARIEELYQVGPSRSTTWEITTLFTNNFSQLQNDARIIAQIAQGVYEQVYGNV